MSLPEGHKEKSKDAWMKLAKSTDAAERKQVSNCLRELGYDPPVFLTWKAEDRVSKVMEHQDGEGKKGKTSNGKAGKAGKGANKAKVGSSKSSGSEGTSSSIDFGPIEAKLEELEAKVTETGEALDVALDYIKETHTMMRVFFQSNEEAKNNLEEVGNYFHGKLMGLEEEEEEGD